MQLTKNPRANRNEFGVARIQKDNKMTHIAAAPELIYDFFEALTCIHRASKKL